MPVLRAFERRLAGAGLFDAVDVQYRQSGPERFDIEVSVEEARTGRVETGVSYGTELLGGDTEILELNLRGAVYFNPFREHVLLFRGGMQSVDALGDTERVPVVLRTYLGGSATLRGFKYRSVSPLDAEGVPVGGASVWWASMEYLLPLLPRLDVSVYLDAGDVSGEALRLSGEGPVSNWGVGLVIRAENFPVRVDLAFPMETLEGDRRNESGGAHVSFSAGYVF